MCLNPVAITREVAGRKYTEHVPCGKCNECIKDKQNEYIIRSMEEAQKRGNVWFFTLTYAPANVPLKVDIDGEIIEEDPETGEVIFSEDSKIMSLNRSDITSWKKRVRTKLNKRRKSKGQSPLDFGYMICGEYGPQTHRPHYHGLFIGLERDDVMEFKQDWESHYGFTTFSYIPSIPVDGVNQVERTSRYVSKYIVKMTDIEDDAVKQCKVEKPRKQTSVGYGMPTRKKFEQMRRYHLCEDMFPGYDVDKLYEMERSDVSRLVREVIKRRRYKISGVSYKLPSYYKKRLFYVKDEFTGKDRASRLQSLVSKTLEMDVRKDYSRKLAEMASHYEDPDAPETYFKASRDLQKSEEIRRQEVSETLFETNLKYIRKSRF